MSVRIVCCVLAVFVGLASAQMDLGDNLGMMAMAGGMNPFRGGMGMPLGGIMGGGMFPGMGMSGMGMGMPMGMNTMGMGMPMGMSGMGMPFNYGTRPMMAGGWDSSDVGGWGNRDRFDGMGGQRWGS